MRKARAAVGARADLALYVVCDTAMIQTDPGGFIRRPTKIDRRRLNWATLANLSAARSQNGAREMVAARCSVQVSQDLPRAELRAAVATDAQQQYQFARARPRTCMAALPCASLAHPHDGRTHAGPDTPRQWHRSSLTGAACLRRREPDRSPGPVRASAAAAGSCGRGHFAGSAWLQPYR